MSASRNCCGVIVSLLVAQAAQLAEAEDQESSGIQEVVVTSQRREQSMLAVPIAVSALTSADLQNQGITQTASLSSVVPNLQVNSGFGDAQPNFSLRGISVGNEYNTNQASPVGVYLDDEYLPFRSTHAMQLYDLERIEVVKGPQGTLFGRNTTGGAINFITRRPDLTSTDGYVDVGYGRFNDVHLQAALQTAPVGGEFGIRAAVNYENAGGYIKNVFPEASDGNSKDTLAGRVIARFKPNEDLDLDLKVYGSHANPTQAQVWQRGTGPGLTNPFTGYSRAALDFWQVDSVRSDHNYTSQIGAVLTAHYRLAADWSLTSLSSYGSAVLTFGQEGAGSPVSLLDTRYHSAFEWLNQEVRVSYAGERLDVQAGAYYGTDHNVTYNRYGFFFFAGPAFAQSVVQHFIQTRASTALFAQSDYKFTDHLSLTLGIRHTWDRAAYRDGSAYIGDINYDPVVYTVGSADTTLPNKKNSEGADTYRVALSYTTDSKWLYYASLNHGYRAGTYSGQGYFSPDQIYLTKPEKVDAYEVGVKGRFLANRFELTAAAFDYNYKDQQINEVVGAVGFLRNAGKSRVRGAESELRAELHERFTARLALAYLDAKYQQLVLSGTVLDGNDLPFAPRFSGNAGFDWVLGSVAGGRVTVSPTLSYTSKEYFSPFNDAAGNGYLNQGALPLLAANLSWQGEHLSVRAWGTNLLNRTNFTYGLNLEQSFGYDYLLPGPPRMYGVAVRYSF